MHISNEQNRDFATPQNNWREYNTHLIELDEWSEQSDFLCNANWGSQPLQNTMGFNTDLPYDDIFKPDTGMFHLELTIEVAISLCTSDAKQQCHSTPHSPHWAIIAGFSKIMDQT